MRVREVTGLCGVAATLGAGTRERDAPMVGRCRSPRVVAETAARLLPLKRQCCARLRAEAEPRVYPRTGAMRSGLESCAAEAAARRLPLKRHCCARLRAEAEPRGYPRV